MHYIFRSSVLCFLEDIFKGHICGVKSLFQAYSDYSGITHGHAYGTICFVRHQTQAGHMQGKHHSCCIIFMDLLSFVLWSLFFNILFSREYSECQLGHIKCHQSLWRVDMLTFSFSSDWGDSSITLRKNQNVIDPPSANGQNHLCLLLSTHCSF